MNTINKKKDIITLIVGIIETINTTIEGLDQGPYQKINITKENIKKNTENIDENIQNRFQKIQDHIDFIYYIIRNLSM